MSVEIVCTNPKCQQRYTLPTSASGKSLKCKACGSTFIAGKTATRDDFIEPAWGDTSKPTATTASGPATIGRFAIRGKLGSGAFGTVYRAYDPQLDRVVALKVPNPGVMTDPKRAERFLREAKAAANLHHPHIVPVFDAGKDGDCYYIASAFIGGKPLAEAIPDGGTDFERAARLARELAEALAYAHEQGVVHRDVKPANIMLDTLDRSHLMDFGLASRQEEAARLTNDGAVMGTPAYMSPEQARGQKGDAKPATDQYAAGVVLYELLTGRTPFSGPPAVVIAAVLSTEPEPPHAHRPDVPKDLETICLKAMAKNPDERYPSCQELAADLRRWQEGELITARELSFRERTVRWVKKEPKLAGAAALFAFVLLCGVVLIALTAQRAGRHADDARAARERAEQAVEEGRGDRRRAETLQTALAEERKRGAVLQAKVEELQKRAEGVPPTGAPMPKAVEIPPPVEPEPKVVAPPPEVIAKGAKKPEARKDGRSVLKGHTDRVTSASFSADGKRIVTASDDKTARVWDARTGAELLTLHGHTDGVSCASFSPDGTRIVTASDDKTARVWDANNGARLLTLRGHTSFVTAASFSADGTRIATASTDDTAKVWDAQNGTELLTLTGHAGSVYSASFSPDGSLVVTGSFDRTARVWNAKTGEGARTLEGHTAGVYAASFSPDGALIVTSSSDDTPKVWNAKTGAEVVTLKGHTGGVYTAAFGADGARVVTGSTDGTARVWNARTGAEVLVLSGHTDSVTSAAFSPDGALIVTGSADKTAIVWEMKPGTTGAPAAPAPVPKAPEPKPPEPPAPAGKVAPVPAKLIGKWTKKDSPGIVEFTKDGKLAIRLDAVPKPIEGTYAVNGDKLSLTLNLDGKDVQDTVTITKLTDAELATKTKDGMVETFTRAKP